MEKRTSWAAYDKISHADLDGIEDAMSSNEHSEMKRKINDLINNMKLENHAQFTLVYDALKRGYLAAHAFYYQAGGAG